MLKLSRLTRSSRYTPIVGCAFLVETLYGSKYSANLGAYDMPYVYVKTILLCATGHGLEVREGRYIHGLIELLLPSKVSQDNLTKLELLQFVDAIPTDCTLEGQEAEIEEEAEVQATMALMASVGSSSSSSNTADHSHQPQRQRAYTYHQHPQRSSHSIFSSSADGHEREREESAAAAQRRRQQEQEEADTAAVESIMSFVSPSTFPSSMARVLVYDAVCTCVADGLYSAKEKERVALVSSHTGLSSAVRGQIENLALQEKVLSIRKRRLLLLQRPPPSHLPQAEEERLRREREDGVNDDNECVDELRHRVGASFASSAPRGVRDVGSVRRASVADDGRACEEREEAKRMETAKTLLRRARQQQKRQRYFAASE